MITWIFILAGFVGLVLLSRASYKKVYTVTYIGDQFFVVCTTYIWDCSLSYQHIGINGTDEEGWLYAKEAIKAAKRLSKGKPINKPYIND